LYYTVSGIITLKQVNDLKLLKELKLLEYNPISMSTHPCPRRDSNTQSQQASGRRPTC